METNETTAIPVPKLVRCPDCGCLVARLADGKGCRGHTAIQEAKSNAEMDGKE